MSASEIENYQLEIENCKLTAGGVRWQVLPEHRELLLGPAGLRLGEWLRGDQAQVIKHGPHRTVYRVALPGLSFYVKHYRLHDTRAWLRELVRPSKARMEYDRAQIVGARGVPTVTPLALGETSAGLRPGDSFLITRSLEDAEPLSVFIEKTLPGFTSPRQTCIRQRLAVALGALVARMHDTGIVHNDLHAGNLLVRLDEANHPHLYLIDLHAVHCRRPLSWRASRANLIMLNRWFILRASRTDRLRFWRAYCRNRGSRIEDGTATFDPLSSIFDLRFRELARDLEQRTWASNLRFWRHRDRRCLVTNRYYQRVRSATVAGYTVTDLDQKALAPLLADPDEPFRRPGVPLLKDSPSSTVAEFELPVNGEMRRVIYKRFRVTSWSDPWAALVRRSPALRSWVFGQGLRERCLPTARPLAVLHRRRHGLTYEGYLLTEMIPNAVDLHRFVASLAALAAPERRARVRCCINQVARLVRELHRRHLSHRDLKAANILVSRIEDRRSKTEEDRSVILDPRSSILDPPVWLIDLVGVTCHRRLSRRRRVRNLARLHASFCQNPALTRTDKLRFLRIYQQWGLLGRHRWKRWWREIEQATRAKVARSARKGRPLA